MKKRTINWSLFGLITTCICSCGNPQKSTSIQDLQGEWIVTEVNNQVLSDTDSQPFIGFDINEKRLYGNSGCNDLNAVIVESTPGNGAISFESMASTQRMCRDMDTETMIINALSQVKSYSLNDIILTLTDENDNELIELKKK